MLELIGRGGLLQKSKALSAHPTHALELEYTDYTLLCNTW